MEAVKKGVRGNWEHMDLNVEFLCSFSTHSSRFLGISALCPGMSAKEEKRPILETFFSSAGLEGILGYKKQCANTNTSNITTADDSNGPFVIPLHPHSKYISTEGHFFRLYDKQWIIQASFFTSLLFVFQFPPPDPPMCLPLPPPLAVSWYAGLRFQSQTEMVSFWATRSVCAFYASQSFFH